ncbi:MAG: DUF3488 and transglutaminase-like domain-containing protein [Candidatus Riflebacteria bacterium]|nr:DUF3488 and transglutaminase-like domain-containing protein [Candidatus Riflebacteria bacterium]
MMTDVAAVLEIKGQNEKDFSRSNGFLSVSTEFFRLLVLLALLSYLAIWSTGYLHGLIEFLTVPLLIVAFVARPLFSGRVFLELGSVIALIYVIVNRAGSTPGVVLLLQFASVIMFFQILVLDCLRAAHGVIILSLMIILAVAAMNINFTFPLALMPYVFVFYLVLRHLAVLRHQAAAAAKIDLSRRNPVGFRRLVIGTLASVMIFGFLWLVMFYLIPRTSSFGIASEVSRRKLKGFSDMMSLGEAGLLEDNPAVVMRVRPLDEKTNTPSVLRRIKNKLLRGTSFVNYSAGKWKKGGGRRWYADLRNNAGELMLSQAKYNPRDLHQLEFILEHIDPPVVFVPERSVKLRFSVPYLAYEDDLSFYFLYRPGMTRKYIASILIRSEEITDSAVDEIGPSRETTPYLDKSGTPQRVESLALNLIGGSKTISERVEKVMRYLRGQFAYSLVQHQVDGVDPVEDFLFVSKEGSCEHFASSMVLLLRVMGIPARPVAGYMMGEWNEIGGFYTIRQRHAHAWVEVFFPKTGWVTFDPTPPSYFDEPETELGRLIQVLWETYEGYWFGYVYSFDNRAQGLGFRRIVEATSSTFVSVRSYLFSSAVWLLLIFVVGLALWGRRSIARRLYGLNCWIPVWYLGWERRFPVSRESWETPAEYHQRLLELGIVRPELGSQLAELAELVDRNAFSTTPDRADIKAAAESVIAEIAAGVSASGASACKDQRRR